MASPTSSHRFLKPTTNEKYTHELINDNSDMIDDAFRKLGVHRLKETEISVGAAVAINTHTNMNALEYRAIRFENWCWVRIYVTTKIELPVNSKGGIASSGGGFKVCEVVEKYRPLISTPLRTMGYGRNISGYLGSGGNVECNFASGTSAIPIDAPIELVGWFPLADGI